MARGAMKAGPAERTFRPDVEGLRALAIGLVVLYHVGIPGFRGGYVGMDVLFVLSGFLITGLLVRERGATGRVSLTRFMPVGPAASPVDLGRTSSYP